MKRLALAIALACALSGAVLAGEVHTAGAPAPGEIPTTGAPSPATSGATHGPAIVTRVILAILSIVR